MIDVNGKKSSMSPVVHARFGSTSTIRLHCIVIFAKRTTFRYGKARTGSPNDV